MSRPSVLRGVLCACGIAILSAPLWWGLRELFSPPFAWRAVLLAAHLTYLGWLVRAAGRRVGNLTLLAANLVLAAVVVALPLALGGVAALLAGLMTLSRTLLFHRRAGAAVLDVLLAASGLLLASQLLASGGGLTGAIWVFLLPQSLFGLLPEVAGDRPGTEREEPSDPFARARRQAEAALGRIVARPSKP